jgi:hypothetical protein
MSLFTIRVNTKAKVPSERQFREGIPNTRVKYAYRSIIFEHRYTLSMIVLGILKISVRLNSINIFKSRSSLKIFFCYIAYEKLNSLSVDCGENGNARFSAL